MLLKELLALSLPARATYIQQGSGGDIAAAVKYVEQIGLAVPAGLDRRLAWAVAFNLQRIAEKYTRTWSPETPFSEYWNTLTQSRFCSDLGHASTLLDNLALSVLCERNETWQPPEASSIDVPLANQTCDVVYNRNRAKIVGHVQKQFGRRAGDPEDIAREAWSRAYASHWSPEAKNRFLGIAQISTLVCQLAYFIAIDILKRDRPDDTTEDSNDGTATSPLDSIIVKDDPAETIQGKEVERIIRTCIEGFPPRQKDVADKVFLQLIPQNEVALALDITRPAVSDHIKKARIKIAEALAQHGIDI